MPEPQLGVSVQIGYHPALPLIVKEESTEHAYIIESFFFLFLMFTFNAHLLAVRLLWEAADAKNRMNHLAMLISASSKKFVHGPEIS